MKNLNGILLFMDVLVGLYLLNLGLNLVPLSFLEPIKEWLIIGGGVLIIITGMMNLRRNSSGY
jgi:hypothetical protein